MLNFFRRYQKGFFIFIAIIITISFSFFGIQGRMSDAPKIEDYSIGKAVDNSKMMRREVDLLTRFLSSDRMDQEAGYNNLFNDGVIRNDLLASGIGKILLETYFEDIKGDLEKRFVKSKRFKPYSHPFAPFLSLENLWGNVMPRHLENFKALKDSQEFTPKALGLYIDLYLGESSFPPHMTRRFLKFQEAQVPGIQKDVNLDRTDLALFNNHSLIDWFGNNCIELMSQFIHNASIVAHEKEYKVSYQEAKNNLMETGMQSLVSMKKDATQDDLAIAYQRHLSYLGMSEKDIVTVWQKIMVARRLFNDYGRSCFLDPLMHKNFTAFSGRTCDISDYNLPEALQLSSIDDLMKFELYLTAVTPKEKKKMKWLDLPKTFLKASDIEKTTPELIEKRFLVEVAHAEMKDVAMQIGVKETYIWQKQNFAQLKKAFSVLSNQKNVSLYEALANLDEIEREKVDAYSRKEMIRESDVAIAKALKDATSEKKVVGLTFKGGDFPFKGVKDRKAFMKMIAEKKSLPSFTSDGENYYSIKVLESSSTPEVLTFAEANERGVMDELLAKHLKERYRYQRNLTPEKYKTKNGRWKSLADAKNDLVVVLYNKVLTAIQKDLAALNNDKIEENAEFLTKHRMHYYMREALSQLKKDPNAKHLVKLASKEQDLQHLSIKPSLQEQWKLTKTERTIRANQEGERVFSMNENTWDSPKVTDTGMISFFRVVKKSQENIPVAADVRKAQNLLSMDARRCLASSMIERIKDSEAIHLVNMKSHAK